MSKVMFTNEIGGSCLSNSITKENYNQVLQNPADYIKSEFNLDLNQAEVKAVSNTNSEINLTLPYYSGIDKMSSSQVSDNELDQTSGGEILVSVIAVTTVAAGVGTAVAAGAMAANGYNIDGSEIKGK